MAALGGVPYVAKRLNLSQRRVYNWVRVGRCIPPMFWGKIASLAAAKNLNVTLSLLEQTKFRNPSTNRKKTERTPPAIHKGELA